jgi:hypothetical protein
MPLARHRSLLVAGVVALIAVAAPAAAWSAGYKIVGPLKGKNRPDLPCCTPFYLLGTPAISGDYVVFTSRNGPGDGIWSYNLKTKKLRKLAGLKTKVPGGKGKFTEFGYAGGDHPTTVGGDVAAFFGRDADNRLGLYTVPVGGGAITPIATTKTKAPGLSETFGDLRHASLNGRTITFWGSAGGITGVYKASVLGNGLAKVIDATTGLTARTPQGPAPDYFHIFSIPKMGKETIVFYANGVFDPSTGANALFRASGGFADIADNMTPLEGGTKDEHVRIGQTSAAVGSSAIAFRADEPVTGYLGVFKVRSLNSADAFATTKDTAPGVGRKFFSFLGFGYDASGLAFTATYKKGDGNLVQDVYFTAAPGKPVVRVAAGANYYLPQAGDRSVSRGRIVFSENTAYAETFYVATPND